MKYSKSFDNLGDTFPDIDPQVEPWQLAMQLETMIKQVLGRPDLIDPKEYQIDSDKQIAIHNSARVDQTARILGPAVIGANAVLREGTIIQAGTVVPRQSYIDQVGH